ncbi:hypothetical protein ACPPVO_58495 [Dactylosporangium sp. McL0621]|uniref:hypothetical protein n=1 Tax=Dactylosporangium sp. McL0621 TaxID=3415678 RepID=UPI003CE853C1
MVDPSGVSTLDELSGLLRDLRRRQARRVRSSPLTFGELAARTGWPHAAIGAYFDGHTLPPAERLDALLRLLGASPAECFAFASARTRIESLSDHRAQLPFVARPRRLPPAPPGFAGRAGAVARLDTLLPGARAVFIGGPAGVGKTALAVHYGHRIADRFPGGAVFLDLRGSGTPLSAAEALRILLDALGVAPADLPLGVAARTGLFRTLTARRGVLLVLDDAADAAQVRPLLPAAGDSVALITGRGDLRPLADDAAAALDPAAAALDPAAAALDPAAAALDPAAAALDPAAAALDPAAAALDPAAAALDPAAAALDPAAAALDPAAAALDPAAAALDPAAAALDPAAAALDPAAAALDPAAAAPDPALVALSGNVLASIVPDRAVPVHGSVSADGSAFVAPDRAVPADGSAFVAPDRLVPADGLAAVVLGPIDRTEARAMLAARMGAERVAAEPEAVDHIITACGRSPMALAVVSARVALHPDLRLSTVADALGEATAFSWSYDLLTPAAQHLFRGFGAHPAQDLSTIDAAVILDGKSTVDSLTELARTQLITEVRPGRYAMHALLREHAAARTPDAEREALEDRIVGHGSSFAVLGLAMRRRRYRDAWRIADAVDGHLDATGRWDDRIAAQEIAIRAAEHLGAPALLARAQRAQSAAYLRTGQHEAALRRLREAADCFHAQGDPAAAAHCRQDLAALLESMARFAEAIVHDELALALFRRAGDHHGQATAHAAAAWHYAQAGRAAEAVAHGEAALALHRELDDPHEVAAALAHLGRVHAALGERERSLERLRAALDRYTELGDRLDEADTATRLGDALDGAPAIGLWRRAHAIYERLGHPAAATVAARLGI